MKNPQAQLISNLKRAIWLRRHLMKAIKGERQLVYEQGTINGLKKALILVSDLRFKGNYADIRIWVKNGRAEVAWNFSTCRVSIYHFPTKKLKAI